MKLLQTEIDDGVVHRRFKFSEMLSLVNGKQLPKFQTMFQTITVPPSSGLSSPRTSAINQFNTVLIHATLDESRHHNPCPEFCVILLNCEKNFFVWLFINCSVLLLMYYTTHINLLELIPNMFLLCIEADKM